MRRNRGLDLRLATGQTLQSRRSALDRRADQLDANWFRCWCTTVSSPEDANRLSSAEMSMILAPSHGKLGGDTQCLGFRTHRAGDLFDDRADRRCALTAFWPASQGAIDLSCRTWVFAPRRQAGADSAIGQDIAGTYDHAGLSSRWLPGDHHAICSSRATWTAPLFGYRALLILLQLATTDILSVLDTSKTELVRHDTWRVFSSDGPGPYPSGTAPYRNRLCPLRAAWPLVC